MKRRYWLMKSEPDTFGYEDLAASPDATAFWDGVRNYQARNFMCEMHIGDQALFYHSSTQPPHVYGVMEVVQEATPDPTQFDPESPHFDARSDPDDPRWRAVTVRAVGRLHRSVPRDDLKANPALEGMPILARNQRLSVQPVDPKHFAEVMRMGGGLAKTS